MSSVSSISSSNYAAYMATNLFSKLDTSGKGYFEQSDLASALSSVTSSSSTQSTSSTSSSANASDIFGQLDSNGDGKVTKDELSTSIKKLAETLNSQFDQSRMDGAAPPPPPNGAQGTGSNDTGFTKAELQNQLSEIGSSDSKRSSLISNIVNNFDKADTNSDGKVSFQEAMAYDKANSTTSSSSSSNSSSSTSTSSTSSTTSSGASSTSTTTDAQIFRQLMELMRAYGNGSTAESTLNTLSSLISTSA